jgi:flagellar biosynthesis protein FliR
VILAQLAATVPRLDLFAPGTAAVLVLFGSRVGGLLLVAPVFSARPIPMTVRTGLLLLLTMLLTPAAMAEARGAEITPAAVLGETLVGFAIGLGAAIIVGAAEAAGDLMAVQIGLSGASIFDPLNATQAPVLGQFAQMFAITLLLVLDAHLVMLDALAESARAVPVGSALDLQAGVGAMTSLLGTLFALGLRFAAPVIAAVLIGNVALAVLSRAAPSLNVLSVAFPLQIGLGLFALAASLGVIATYFTGWTSTYEGMLTHVFGAMSR